MELMEIKTIIRMQINHTQRLIGMIATPMDSVSN